MIGGAALSARAIGDASRRELASSWGGPDPRLAPTVARPPRERVRRLMLHKP
ncbi:hypothetical protein [Sphingopyxis indica]|uniref:Uncharacterized protein n=1 Tax=Sphingopyxis indica TaxID=436663 RepID=A0A239JL50_9SPHN|nr:hypothetical protein [Sphingopyxis indica]WOF43690.1 hypothetical protein KNJ79_01605 [Sphingopyxis indica]SNT06033.1 hypothetical protein SAMN06295955_110116 [Sphingopyxis indica]